MLSTILLLVLLLTATIALVALERRAGPAGTGPKTVSHPSAQVRATPAGRALLGVLEQAVAPDHRILAGVRIADLADLAEIEEQRARDGAHPPARDGASAMHIDFLVCRNSDLAPVCAIAVNDDACTGRKARPRDPLLANLCKTIGLPLLHVPLGRGHSVRDVHDQLRVAVQPAVNASAAPAAKPRARREPMLEHEG